MRRVLGAAAVALAALLLSGCGGDGAVVERDDGPVHVHGLGVDPADRSLYIATHTGMWRLERGAVRPQRVTDLRQDTMGFTVAGPRHFLGSGHPDIAEMRERGLPPHLGLIESRDGGRSWSAVSLSGEADFHVLRSARSYVYGFDASSGRLLRSADRGRTWQQAAAPADLVDLAPHPEQPRRLLASTLQGLFSSSDGGRTWERQGSLVALLAWRAAARVVAVRANGAVLASSDAGRSWREVGDAGGEPAALTAANGPELYVALHDGAIRRSLDGGARWSTLNVPG